MSAILAIMDRSRATSMLEARDHRIVLHGVSWADYDTFDRVRGPDTLQPRLSYLDGTLELMTTGLRHELVKKLLARLIEAYADECELELIGIGNATFRKKARKAGAEPDECYWLDDQKAVPDLAIEIVHTSGGVDKLEIYRRLGVREVWFWIDEDFAVYRLAGERYRKHAESIALRGIDLAHVAELLRTTEVRQQALVARAYRRSLRA
jgi:Uma2 family endonuclease